ncbi:hypothetical protein C8R43DRAFT_1133474 [Mycena crocata]|nr:hypothetical protein C8R43DRAFT_1133474 [Mycena crocata]
MFLTVLLLTTFLAFTAVSYGDVASLEGPPSAMSGGFINITWVSDESDNFPVTIALFSTNPTYNGPFAIANNVNAQANRATIGLPQLIPGSGYTMALISMSNTSDVLLSSPPFSITPAAISTAAKSPAHPPSSTKESNFSSNNSHFYSASINILSSAAFIAPSPSYTATISAYRVSTSHSVIGNLPLSAVPAPIMSPATARSGAATTSASGRTSDADSLRVWVRNGALVLGCLVLGAVII